jgi:DNA-binding transcriptional MocR family regulator
VLVESPTYLGMVHILKTYGLRPISVPMDDEGPDLTVIERAMHHDRPRFFYTVPTFHNPTGLCMSETRRRDLLDLAASYKLPIIEDDIYGPLALDGPAPLTLRSMDRDGIVIYVGSASKVLMPGLRVGWMVASSELQHELILRRLAIDLFGPPFVQRALALFIQQGRLKAHLKRVLPVFRTRRDALMKALRRHMPEGVTWTQPVGGFSTWATLPADIMTSVYHGALQRGVAFTPGTAFLADSTSDRYMRLCYSTQPVEELDGIVALLAGVIRERLANPIEAENIGQLWTAMA